MSTSTVPLDSSTESIGAILVDSNVIHGSHSTNRPRRSDPRRVASQQLSVHDLCIESDGASHQYGNGISTLQLTPPQLRPHRLSRSWLSASVPADRLNSHERPLMPHQNSRVSTTSSQVVEMYPPDSPNNNNRRARYHDTTSHLIGNDVSRHDGRRVIMSPSVTSPLSSVDNSPLAATPPRITDGRSRIVSHGRCIVPIGDMSSINDLSYPYRNAPPFIVSSFRNRLRREHEARNSFGLLSGGRRNRRPLHDSRDVVSTDFNRHHCRRPTHPSISPLDFFWESPISNRIFNEQLSMESRPINEFCNRQTTFSNRIPLQFRYCSPSLYDQASTPINNDSVHHYSNLYSSSSNPNESVNNDSRELQHILNRTRAPSFSFLSEHSPTPLIPSSIRPPHSTTDNSNNRGLSLQQLRTVSDIIMFEGLSVREATCSGQLLKRVRSQQQQPIMMMGEEDDIKIIEKDYYYDEDMEADSKRFCAICCSEFLSGEPLRTILKCGHRYHVTCVDRWFEDNTTCPICRSNLKSIGNSVLEFTNNNPHLPVVTSSSSPRRPLPTYNREDRNLSDTPATPNVGLSSNRTQNNNNNRNSSSLMVSLDQLNNQQTTRSLENVPTSSLAVAQTAQLESIGFTSSDLDRMSPASLEVLATMMLPTTPPPHPSVSPTSTTTHHHSNNEEGRQTTTPQVEVYYAVQSNNSEASSLVAHNNTPLTTSHPSPTTHEQNEWLGLQGDAFSENNNNSQIVEEKKSPVVVSKRKGFFLGLLHHGRKDKGSSSRRRLSSNNGVVATTSQSLFSSTHPKKNDHHIFNDENHNRSIFYKWIQQFSLKQKDH